MNREAVRSVSLPVRVATGSWGWFGSIRFGSLQYFIELLLFSKEVYEEMFGEAVNLKYSVGLVTLRKQHWASELLGWGYGSEHTFGGLGLRKHIGLH